MILLFLFAVFAFFFCYGVLAFLKAIVASADKPVPQYTFRFGTEVGPSTVRGILPGAVFETSGSCPFCRRPTKVIATRENVRIECPYCGVLEGTADIPGIGVYSIPVPKPPNLESL